MTALDYEVTTADAVGLAVIVGGLLIYVLPFAVGAWFRWFAIWLIAVVLVYGGFFETRDWLR